MSKQHDPLKSVGESARRVGQSARKVSQVTTGAFVKTAGIFGSTIKGIGHGLFQPIHSVAEIFTPPPPGSVPGIETYLKDEERAQIPVKVTIIDYGAELHESFETDDVEQALARPRPEGAHVRWINIDGINPRVIDRISKAYGIHTLAAEDVHNVVQRPKVEPFDEHLFVVVRQIQLIEDKMRNEQVSLFLFGDTLITFQEFVGDVFDPIRQRIGNPAGRFRTNGPDYLLYALLDSAVDHLFPMLERYGIELEDLEEEISTSGHPSAQRKLFAMKRNLSALRRTLWPMREVVDQLYRSERPIISDFVKTYMRDVQDHAMQILDIVETYRETAASLNDLYQSMVGNRMNEIMKVLTIMASFFIPITFIAGVYGMNFEHIPELGWRYAYYVFWGVCLTVSASLAVFFWRRGWIGGGR